MKTKWLNPKRVSLVIAMTYLCLLNAGCLLDKVVSPVGDDQRLNYDFTFRAGDPVPSDFRSEQDLPQNMAALRAQFSQGQAGSLVGAAGVRFNYRFFPKANEKGAIVLLPGRTEPIAKYEEVIADLLDQGYSVYAMDPRGQGESQRMLPNPKMGYVERFDDYVTDLHLFVTTVVLAKPHAATFLLAHSMGGATSLKYIQKHPGIFRAVALSSPMVEVEPGSYAPSVAQSLSFSFCGSTEGKAYALGEGDPVLNKDFSAKDNDVTRSRARFDAKVSLYEARPELTLGGVTWRWLCEVFHMSNVMKASGAKIIVPTLIMAAGPNSDTVVRARASQKMCEQSHKCQWIGYEGAYHELMMEVDSVRNDFMTKAIRFFRAAERGAFD